MNSSMNTIVANYSISQGSQDVCVPTGSVGGTQQKIPVFGRVHLKPSLDLQPGELM